ncbi:MAG: hypothetical protein LBU38_05425 [Propionibacteriaceae bacterium]|jgi:hypothetical protein|nr:hypothetical protein [Propionibacteriaceae bacterium]
MTIQTGSDTQGETQGTTVTVSQVVSKSLKETWKLIVSKEGNEALLGKGGIIGDKGDEWHSEEGTFGVIRSYHPLEQIRFYWYAAEGAPKTVVEVVLSADGEGTLITISHQRVPAYFDQTKLANRWQAAIDNIVAL